MLALEKGGLSISPEGFFFFFKGALEECSNAVLVSHLVLQMGISEWLGYHHNTGRDKQDTWTKSQLFEAARKGSTINRKVDYFIRVFFPLFFF